MAYSKIKKDGTPALPTKHKTDRRKGYKVEIGEFIRITNNYLRECEESKKTPLLIELAQRLGIDEETLWGYRKNRVYANVIKRVDEIAHIGWIRLAELKNKPIFPMFMLKAKYDYVEKQYQKVDFNVSGQLGVVQMPIKKPKVNVN